TGRGRALAAKALHQSGHRANRRCVIITCSAMPAMLLMDGDGLDVEHLTMLPRSPAPARFQLPLVQRASSKPAAYEETTARRRRGCDFQSRAEATAFRR